MSSVVMKKLRYKPNFSFSSVNFNHQLEVGRWNKFPRSGNGWGPGGYFGRILLDCLRAMRMQVENTSIKESCQ